MLRNLRTIKRIDAIYMRVLEGEGVPGDPCREEEYIYLEKEDRLFVIDRIHDTITTTVLGEENESTKV